MANGGTGKSGFLVLIAVLLAAMAVAGGIGASTTFSKIRFHSPVQHGSPGKPTCVPSPNYTVMPTC